MAPLAEYTVSASYSSDWLWGALPSALLAGLLLQRAFSGKIMHISFMLFLSFRYTC